MKIEGDEVEQETKEPNDTFVNEIVSVMRFMLCIVTCREQYRRVIYC